VCTLMHSIYDYMICYDREDLMGFTLEFHFETNSYFTNTVLTKTYETANLLDHVSLYSIYI
jgi:hypothetical protein